MATRTASVTYDPHKVREESIREAINEADRHSAAAGNEAAPEAGLLLGEERRDNDS